jgi:hypothetical protein
VDKETIGIKRNMKLNLTGIKCHLLVITAGMLLFSGCNGSKSSEDYPVKPVPFTSVKLTDNFWAPRILKNAEVTIPIAFRYCESTGRIRNFEIAGGLDTGRFQTIYPFDDSDVFKIMEGAAYSLQTKPDPKLDAYLDTRSALPRKMTGICIRTGQSLKCTVVKDFMNGQAKTGGSSIPS